MSTGVRATRLSRNLLIAVALLASAWHAQAIQWTLTSAGPPTWTYTLTFDPLDNCNIFVSPSTITMTGLGGVTAAGAPTGSDFSGSLDTNNRNWTPVVSGGGTTVTWTNPTCGSGNFGVAKHVTGFTITAAGRPSANVTFATNGMAKDTGSPNSIDVTGSVAGPTPPPIGMINISTRGQVLTGNDRMIAGFIISGSTKTVVVNVAGPSLVPLGIPNALTNPKLTIVRASDQTIIAANDDWQTQTNPADVAAIQASGFAPNNALEPAVILTLPPGAYTAIVEGVGGGTGVGLVGVFAVN